MSKNRVAWLRVVIGQFVLMRYTADDVDDQEQLSDEQKDLKETLGPTYRVLLPRPGGRPVTYDMTALTHEEFLGLKEFWMHVFERVEPIVIERDRVAQDAYEKGDDSFARIYRQAPQLVFREGTVGEDDQSLRVGPEDLSSGDVPEGDGLEDVGSGGGLLRGHSDGVAPTEPQAGSSEDDKPATD